MNTHAELNRRENELNQAILHTAFAQHGVASVRVFYDGQGDSGEIEDVDFFDANGDILHIGDETVSGYTIQQKTGPDGMTLEPCLDKESVTLTDMMISYTERVLETYHQGWEDNEGAFGELTWDIQNDDLQLEHQERFIETETFSHSL